MQCSRRSNNIFFHYHIDEHSNKKSSEWRCKYSPFRSVINGEWVNSYKWSCGLRSALSIVGWPMCWHRLVMRGTNERLPQEWGQWICVCVSVGDFILEKLHIVLILGHFYISRTCAKAIKTWKQDRMCASFLGPLWRHIQHNLIKIIVIILVFIILNQLLFSFFSNFVLCFCLFYYFFFIIIYVFF